MMVLVLLCDIMHAHPWLLCVFAYLQVMSRAVIPHDVPVFRNDGFAANIDSNLSCTGREASLGSSTLHIMHDSNDAKSSIRPGRMH